MANQVGAFTNIKGCPLVVSIPFPRDLKLPVASVAIDAPASARRGGLRI